MSLEAIFQACQALAMIGWVALVAAPLARARLVMAARGVVALLCLAYFIQFFTITQPSGGNFGSLAGVTALFSLPGNVMLGWTHFLAFDLFIGSWITEDAGREEFPHWAIIPILVLTLMLGPVGLLTWLIVRTIHRARNKRKLI